MRKGHAVTAAEMIQDMKRLEGLREEISLFFSFLRIVLVPAYEYFLTHHQAVLSNHVLYCYEVLPGRFLVVHASLNLGLRYLVRVVLTTEKQVQGEHTALPPKNTWWLPNSLSASEVMALYPVLDEIREDVIANAAGTGTASTRIVREIRELHTQLSSDDMTDLSLGAIDT